MRTILKKHLNACQYDFPHPNFSDPQGVGVVAIGGDLQASTLITAYSQGLFPWFNDDDDPIAWWSPDPRCVLNPQTFQPSKSLIKQVKKSDWLMTVNADFKQVIYNCSLPRSYSQETWITDEMRLAYIELYKLGFAYSVEIWDYTQSELLGGLYGVKIGGVFCGESMFHHATNVSKIAFWRLCQLCKQTGVEMIDCQLPNAHLLSLGADIMERDKFLQQLPKLINKESHSWDTISTKKVTELL